MLAKRLNITTAALQSAIGQARTDVGLPGAGSRGPGHGPVARSWPRRSTWFERAALAIGISAKLRQRCQAKSLAAGGAGTR
jgi:hypothetical protein